MSSRRIAAEMRPRENRKLLTLNGRPLQQRWEQLFQRQYETWRSFGYVVDCVLHDYVEVSISKYEADAR